MTSISNYKDIKHATFYLNKGHYKNQQNQKYYTLQIRRDIYIYNEIPIHPFTVMDLIKVRRMNTIIHQIKHW